MNNIRTEFKKLAICKIYRDWKSGIEKENRMTYKPLCSCGCNDFEICDERVRLCCSNCKMLCAISWKIPNFSIGRVMHALPSDVGFYQGQFFKIREKASGGLDFEPLKIFWQSLKEDKSEATDDDQSDETITNLLNLLK